MKCFKNIKPLSNYDIIDICNKLDIQNFKGVFMRDELKDEVMSRDESLVVNSDISSGRGIHWMC